MLQKMILLIISAIFLTGCGAAAPDEFKSEAAVPSRFQCPAGEADTAATASGSSAIPADPEECPETSEAEYFLFDTYTNSVEADNGLTLLYESQTQASFVSADEGRSAWVEEILEGILRNFAEDSSNLHEYAREFVESDGTEYFYSYSNYQQLGVARHDETVVSLISLSSIYSGGSHPNSVQTAYNLDIQNRRLLRLEDVIDGSSAGELANLVRSGVDERFAVIDGGNGLFDDYADTISISMSYGNMTPYWYLNDVGLVIFYNQYELGPYAAGIIKVELPYEALEGILLEEYLPAEPDGTPGDLLLRGDIAGRNAIPITIEPEGQTLLVGVEGTVHQVQLSEVMWLEDTPVAQELLFSALSLGQDDILEISGGYDDASRSFAIEFTNGAGERRIYYLHDGELSEEP